MALDEKGLPCTATMRLQNVDRLDGVFDVSPVVDSLDDTHSIDSHRCEEVVIAMTHLLPEIVQRTLDLLTCR